MSAWTDHVDRWKNCTACPLGLQRSRIVLARGVVPCDVLFVGEAPGVSEDTLGLPFVGPAGDLLDRIIARALEPYPQVTVALTNLVACFPREAKATGDNEPERDEILACRARLVEFVNIAQPRLIVCVGKLSTRYIDHNDTVRCADIDHPAYILRMPLAQKNGAAQRTAVVIRNAVEDILGSEQAEFTKWGNTHAGTQRASAKPDQHRYDSTDTDDIPF